jgi:hypothetical protein
LIIAGVGGGEGAFGVYMVLELACVAEEEE